MVSPYLSQACIFLHTSISMVTPNWAYWLYPVLAVTVFIAVDSLLQTPEAEISRTSKHHSHLFVLPFLLVILSTISVWFLLGSEIAVRAFLESLSLINQSIGEVAFGIVVVAITAIWEYLNLRKKQTKTDAAFFQLTGRGVFVAVVVWFLIFSFKSLVGVPRSINRVFSQLATPISKMPSVPIDALIKAPRNSPTSGAHTAHSSYSCLANIPAAYKDLMPEQIAEWGIRESDKLYDLTSKYEDMALHTAQNEMTYGEVKFQFVQEFRECCWPALKDVRMAVLACAGPAGVDSEEGEHWSLAFPKQDLQWSDFFDLNMHMIKDYAPLLRRISVYLERQYVQRPEPQNLEFSESHGFGTKDFPYRTVALIKTHEVRRHGYVAIFLSERPAISGCGYKQSERIDDGRQIAYNDELSGLVDNLAIPHCVVWLGSASFGPTSPLPVDLMGRAPIHVLRAQYIPE